MKAVPQIPVESYRLGFKKKLQGSCEVFCFAVRSTEVSPSKHAHNFSFRCGDVYFYPIPIIFADQRDKNHCYYNKITGSAVRMQLFQGVSYLSTFLEYRPRKISSSNQEREAKCKQAKWNSQSQAYLKGSGIFGLDNCISPCSNWIF